MVWMLCKHVADSPGSSKMKLEALEPVSECRSINTSDVAQSGTQYTPEHSVDLRRKKYHHKTRSGCDTCKTRRVRCDEGKPACQRCIKGRRQCSYNIPQPKVFELYEQKDSHYWRLYLQKTARWVASYQVSVGEPFMLELAPQLSHSHTAIEGLLLGIARVQDTYLVALDPARPPIDRLQVQKQAVECYSYAISALAHTETSGLSPEVLLTGCFLLAVFDRFQNFADRVCLHVEAALKILHELKPHHPHSRILDVLRRLTETFAIDCLAFRDSFSLGTQDLISEDYLITRGMHVPYLFNTLGDAYECLDSLMKILVCSTAKPVSPAKVTVAQNIPELLQDYSACLARSFCGSRQELRPSAHHDVRCLQMHTLVTQIMAATLHSEDQGIYDQFNDMFDSVVIQTEQILNTMGCSNPSGVHLGTNAPLFYTATRCRDPEIRRRAVELLHSSKVREVHWASCTASRIAARAIEIEVGELDYEIRSSDDVPSERRIRIVNADYDQKENCTILRYKRQPWDENSPVHEDREIKWGQNYKTHGLTRESNQEKLFRTGGYGGTLVTRRKIDCVCPTWIETMLPSSTKKPSEASEPDLAESISAKTTTLFLHGIPLRSFPVN